MVADVDSIFARSPTASWQPDGGPSITFAVKNIIEAGGNRLSPRERLYRAGAKQDDTGPMADSFATVSHFFNGMRQPDVPANGYPGVLNALIESLKKGVGTLTLETRGPLRARAHTWQRTESDERVDFAVLQINWVLDNEDEQTAATFLPPEARSAVVPLAAQVVEALAIEGCWSPAIVRLNALAAELERVLLTPQSFADDIREQAGGILDACAQIEATFAAPMRVPTDPTAGLLLVPSAHATLPLLRSLAEMARRARAAATGASMPVTRLYSRAVSLAFVAADVGQALDELAALNASLPDIRRIPPGTPIRVRSDVVKAA